MALRSAIWRCFFGLKVGTMGTTKPVLVLNKNLQGLAGDSSKICTCRINSSILTILNIKRLCGAMVRALSSQSSIEGSSPTRGSSAKIFFDLFFRKNVLKSPWPNISTFSKIHFATSILH